MILKLIKFYGFAYFWFPLFSHSSSTVNRINLAF